MTVLNPPAPVIVPDLHGRPDLLQLALDQFPGRQLVTLGDYWDRGPDVPGLMALLRTHVESGRVLALWGNHDHMGARVLLDGMVNPHWEYSYLNHSLAQYPSHAAAVEDARWMSEHLVQWHRWRHVYLSHAAPHRAWNPDRELPEHLWGRPGDEDRCPLPDGCTLAVHGHTVTMTIRPDQQPLPVMLQQPDGSTALYLDTGAYHTHILTVLDLANMEFHALYGRRRWLT